MTALEQIARDAFDAGVEAARQGAADGARGIRTRYDLVFERWLEHRLRFRRGARVKFKVRKRGRTSCVGVIRNDPGPTATTAYVVWPNAWSGYVHLDELEVVL